MKMMNQKINGALNLCSKFEEKWQMGLRKLQFRGSQVSRFYMIVKRSSQGEHR